MIGIVFLLTLFRIWLAVKTPLYLQADAGYDDMLFVRYAVDILNGNWLGDYQSLTLAKTISYPLILAINYQLGIPYSFGLICSYILSTCLLVLAINQFVRNHYFALLGYLFLLYSPVMFHEENVQKVYRGGYIVVFSMFVVAAVIGMFAEAKNLQSRKMYAWSALGVFALPFFWYLKEDSIWLLPFILVGTAITICTVLRIHCGKSIKVKRIVTAVLPLLALMMTTLIYQQINHHYYQLAAVTDRSGTNFEKFISDLIRIEDDSTDTVWITRNMLEQAENNSPTLMSIKPQIDERMYAWVGDNEISGDIIIWVIREAADSAGVYSQGSLAAEQFYGDIHRELQEAYQDGRLISNEEERIYVSSVSRGYTLQEFWTYFRGRIGEVYHAVVGYEQNATTLNAARGSYEDIALMARLTNSDYVWRDTTNDFDVKAGKIVELDQKIVRGYQLLGHAMFYLGMLGIAVLGVRVVIKGKKRKLKENEWQLLVITVGLCLTILVLLVAVMWFCNFLSIRKVYDYMCGAFPLITIVEVVGIWQILLLIQELAGRYVNKKK